MRQRLSGLWMVINRPHAMKNHGWAKTSASSVEALRLNRRRRANHGSDGASPYAEHPELLQLLTS
jgi:hypothetical protein